MNAIEAEILQLLLPTLEASAMTEWQTVGLPAVTAKAMSLAPGKGQEEAMILVNALDQIVKFEVARKLP
jgi:hypothetical protein